LTDLLIHFLIGIVGATTGYAARGVCSHRHHQIIVGLLAIAAESTVSVILVG
jgi:hypothetical protein